MIQPREGENEAVIRRRLQEQFGLPESRLNFSLQIIEALTPEAVRRATDAEVIDMYKAFAANVRRGRVPGLTGPALAAFSRPWRQSPAGIDAPIEDPIEMMRQEEKDRVADASTDQLTDRGVALLRHLADSHEST